MKNTTINTTANKVANFVKWLGVLATILVVMFTAVSLPTLLTLWMLSINTYLGVAVGTAIFGGLVVALYKLELMSLPVTST